MKSPMKLRFPVAIALLSSAPSVAHAADFLGPRLQVIAGWDEIDFEDDGRGIDESISGATYGIATGYDLAVSPTVIVGIGTSATLSDNKTTLTRGADSIRLKAKRDFELAARVGTILAEAALIYAKVGYANAKVEVKSTIAGITDSDTRSGSGLRLGVGTEIAVTEPLAVVIEYRYTDYEKGFTRNQVVGGLSYRF